MKAGEAGKEAEKSRCRHPFWMQDRVIGLLTANCAPELF
jgi:hypothetical protein